MLIMHLVSFGCGHARRLHWPPEHGWYWCVRCGDMRRVLGSLPVPSGQ